MQIEQKSVASIQARLKELFDEVWAEHAARGMTPQLLPKTFELTAELLENPLLQDVGKKLIGA